MEIKIEASDLSLSDVEVKELEREANDLANEHNYSLHAIMHHFGLRKQLSC